MKSQAKHGFTKVYRRFLGTRKRLKSYGTTGNNVFHTNAKAKVLTCFAIPIMKPHYKTRSKPKPKPRVCTGFGIPEMPVTLRNQSNCTKFPGFWVPGKARNSKRHVFCTTRNAMYFAQMQKLSFRRFWGYTKCKPHDKTISEQMQKSWFHGVWDTLKYPEHNQQVNPCNSLGVSRISGYPQMTESLRNYRNAWTAFLARTWKIIYNFRWLIARIGLAEDHPLGPSVIPSQSLS